MTLHPTPPPARLGNVNRAVGSRWLASQVRLPPVALRTPCGSWLAAKAAPPRLALRATASHQPQPPCLESSAPRPPASCCGSFLTSTPRLRPPIRGRSFGNALRERLPCRRRSLARAAASGRYWHQALSSSLPALPRSCLACAAWSFLRERLTPRPPAAGGGYRFGFRQNKLGQLVGLGSDGEWASKQGQVTGSTLLNRRSGCRA